MPDLMLKNLATIRQKYPDVAEALDQIISSANHVARQTNASPVGETPPPPPHTSISVKGGGGFLDIALTHASPTYRGMSHFVEIADNPSFSGYRKVEVGAGLHLRENVGSGTWHTRSCTAFSTSGPSAYLPHGAVSASGPDLPPMQNGQTTSLPGGGYGAVPYTGPTPPKRA